MSLFGSNLKNIYNENSDIDLLVQFEENSCYGLLDIAQIESEFSEIIGKRVDLRTEYELSRYFRDTVVKVAAVKYED